MDVRVREGSGDEEEKGQKEQNKEKVCGKV